MSDKIARRVEFSDEKEIEKYYILHKHDIFGENIVYLEGKCLEPFVEKKKSIPDAIVINYEELSWKIVEYELIRHGAHEHIIPQISRIFSLSEKNEKNKDKVIKYVLNLFNENPGLLKKICESCEISNLEILEKTRNILNRHPSFLMPIDYSNKDLEKYFDSSLFKIKIVETCKVQYPDNTTMTFIGNTLYESPGINQETDIEDDITNFGKYNRIPKKIQLLIRKIEKNIKKKDPCIKRDVTKNWITFSHVNNKGEESLTFMYIQVRAHNLLLILRLGDNFVDPKNIVQRQTPRKWKFGKDCYNAFVNLYDDLELVCSIIMQAVDYTKKKQVKKNRAAFDRDGKIISNTMQTKIV